MQLGKGRGRAVCSNGQTAVDSQPTLSGAHDVPKATSDRAGLSPLALQATAIRGGPCEAVAEVGDDHGEAGTTYLAAGRTPSVARPITAATATLGLLSKDAVP